ncbi:hypothetical protein F4781DRAFT_274255 [Annulohypoxylon bovei var. microspora]|nr:hypothetical protein F4781DRAFT_274255 [Annulohypoxylon bovei var. microspora]
MQFKSSLATLAAAAGLAASYETTPFIGPLQPWQVSQLTISLPPQGEAGTVDIELAIANPNQVSAGPAPHAAGGGYLPFAPSAANCSAVGGSDVASLRYACEETTQDSYGVWSAFVRNTSAAVDPDDLELVFGLSYNVTRWNAVWWKVYEATARFALNDNLVLGECADPNRNCTYELNPDMAPLLVQPVMVQCQGTCEAED